MERNKKSNASNTQSNDKTGKHTHIYTLTESKSHLLYFLNLSLSYIQRAGPADPWTPPSHPSVWPPSALCAFWFRPAVAALAASGADPPHLNASDIYVGRTTGGGGGGARSLHHQWTWALLLRVSLSAPPLLSFLSAVPCFEETMCSGCLCHLRENKMELPQQWGLRCYGLFFFFFFASWIAAVWGRRLSNKWDLASISSHMNEIKGPARCPHYGCSFLDDAFPCYKHRPVCMLKMLE